MGTRENTAKVCRTGLLVSLVCFVLFARAETEDFTHIAVKAKRLTTGLYVLEGAGGNMTALIGPEGVLLVDDDFPQMADKILAQLTELQGGSPRYIVNTHFHYDHTGGNTIFGPKATIVAAAPVRTRLMSEQTLWHQKHPPFPRAGLPNLTFETRLMLDFNSETIEILHLPNGHTDGDSVVFFKNSKVASLGDLYFSGMFPIFHPEHGGSLEGYLQNIETVLKRIPSETQIVPGHGPVATTADLQRYTRMIRASLETVKKAKLAGKTLPQIQKAGLAAEWDSFSQGYLKTEDWLALVYKGLKD